MPFKSKTEKRLGFSFLKTRSFSFQTFWNNLSQNLGELSSSDQFGPMPIRSKKSYLCFGGLKMIILLQNFANLKILTCSLDWEFKNFRILEYFMIFLVIYDIFHSYFLAFFRVLLQLQACT